MSEPLLFDDLDESAFFLPADQTRKRYTSEQVKGIETKRQAVVVMVSYGVPAEVIARELHMSLRTVSAIATQASQKVAGFRKEYSESLLRLGAKSFALALTKMDEASYLQLMTGAGIATDKAIALAAMGEVGEEKVVKEAQDHALVCAELRRIMSPTDAQSGGQALEDKELASSEAGAGAGAGTGRSVGQEGAGGGSGGSDPPGGSMGPGFVDLATKG